MLKQGRPAATGIETSQFETLIADAEAFTAGSFARLSRATGTKVITSPSVIRRSRTCPRTSTSSSTPGRSKGSTKEGHGAGGNGMGHPRAAAAEERAHADRRPGNQIFLRQPGVRTFVHSWVPAGGPIIGMVVRHAESFTISDHLTVWEADDRRRPRDLPADRALCLPAVRQRAPEPARARDAELPAAAEAADHVGRESPTGSTSWVCC
jgi:homospermidine synthase